MKKIKTKGSFALALEAIKMSFSNIGAYFLLLIASFIPLLIYFIFSIGFSYVGLIDFKNAFVVSLAINILIIIPSSMVFMSSYYKLLNERASCDGESKYKVIDALKHGVQSTPKYVLITIVCFVISNIISGIILLFSNIGYIGSAFVWMNLVISYLIAFFSFFWKYFCVSDTETGFKMGARKTVQIFRKYYNDIFMKSMFLIFIESIFLILILFGFIFAFVYAINSQSISSLIISFMTLLIILLITLSINVCFKVCVTKQYSLD